MGEPFDHTKKPPQPQPMSSPPPSSESEKAELQLLEHAPPFWRNRKKRLSKQLSMCETPRDAVWERRRRNILKKQATGQNISHNNKNNSHSHSHNNNNNNNNNNDKSGELTDDDLKELKGCIELGFGFNEEDGQRLCNTLPALDLYFAVNRQFSTSPLSSPGSTSSSTTPITATSTSLGGRSSSFDSPNSDSSDSSWKICPAPGDSPQQVKNKLRHWAQAVACSVMQSN